MQMISKKFPPLQARLGLYPIVDSMEWVKKLLPLGVKALQIRIKNKTGEALSKEIQACIELAKPYGIQLFINDYWELAIAYEAYGVHLGQEDLTSANLQKIRDAGLRLGISAYNLQEVNRALLCQPSYIACGPIYSTNSKVMVDPPQGIAGLQHWQQKLDYPLVAIGGINLNNIKDVVATGVNGIALISAITQAEYPLEAAKKLIKIVENKYEQ